MSKLVKNIISDELKRRYSETDSAVWVEMVGVDGLTTNSFRRELRKNKLRLEVVKTALLRRAVDSRPLSRLAKEMKGPASLISGEANSAQIGKLLKPWFEKIQQLKVRGALLEGEFVDEAACKDLDKMPTRRDLQGRVAAAALSPGAKLAGAIKSPAGNIAACIKAIADKLEKGEEIKKLSA